MPLEKRDVKVIWLSPLQGLPCLLQAVQSIPLVIKKPLEHLRSQLVVKSLPLGVISSLTDKYLQFPLANPFSDLIGVNL